MKKFKKVTAFVLALLMLIAYVPAGLIDGLFVTKVKAESKTYTLDASEIEKFAASEKTDGQIVSAGENDYFSIVASAKTAVQDNSKTFANANGNNYLYGLIVTESDSGSVTPEILMLNFRSMQT